MKKRLFTLVAALFMATSMFAQFEVKVNPIGLLFGGISASGEYILNDNMGVEVSARLSSNKLTITTEETKLTGFGIGAAYKYYFSPDDGADKFYANLYARYGGLSGKYTGSISAAEEKATYSKVAVGFGIGYKWLADSGLLFELGFGAGRNLAQTWSYSDNTNYSAPQWGLDLTGKLAIGWRF